MENTEINKQLEIHSQAKLLPKEERKNIIGQFPEIELHSHLKELFSAMEPNYTIEITHGCEEFGKDLVIVKRDKFGIDVIGVIVKKGEIRGKTLGDVDDLKNKANKILKARLDTRMEEIISQIEQAFTHQADLKTIFANLPVSKVFVILAGEISRQAKKRLQGEVADVIEVFDIDWLVDNFTDYYPQVFFEGKVIDFLQDKITKLELKHWLSKTNMSLSEYFIEPLVLVIDVPDKVEEIDLALMIRSRRIPFLQIKSALTQCKKLILVGEPGVGKSAAFTKFAIDMLKAAYAKAIKRQYKEEKISVPVLIPAKDFLTIDTIQSLLNYYFVSPEIIDRFHVQSILIDALDEIPPGKRNEIIQKAETFSKELACCLVITSRKIEIIDSPPAGFDKYELLPFEFKQALKLFENLIKDRKTLDALRDGLEKIKFQIPMVPLSLLLLLELVEEHKEMPASVTELYDRYFDIDLGRYDRDKGIEVLFEYLIKKKLLAELAYREFYKKGRLEIPRGDFETFLSEYAERYNWDIKDVYNIVREIERSGILDVKKIVLFRHRSFLDYFAAFYIYEKREEFENLNDMIVKIYFDEVWGDVAFFYIGLKREISDAVLEKIFTFDQKDFSSVLCKFCAGRLLQAGWHSPSKTMYQGVKEAISTAPKLREKIIGIMGKSKRKIPIIFVDLILMAFSEFSFSSGFLKNELVSLIKTLTDQDFLTNFYSILLLAISAHRLLDHQELKEISLKIFDRVSKTSALTQEQKGVALVALMVLDKKDPDMIKTLKKKLNRLTKQDPETFKKLLPYKKKGYR